MIERTAIYEKISSQIPRPSEFTGGWSIAWRRFDGKGGPWHTKSFVYPPEMRDYLINHIMFLLGIGNKVKVNKVEIELTEAEREIAREEGGRPGRPSANKAMRKRTMLDRAVRMVRG